MGFAQAMPSLLRTPHLVFRSPDRPRLLLLHHGLDLLVPGVISTVQGDGGCEEGADVTPAPPLYALRPTPPAHCPPHPCTCEEVPAVFLELLRLRVQAPAAAARGGGQPLPQSLQGRAAFGDAEDHDGVVLHVVEALDG